MGSKSNGYYTQKVTWRHRVRQQKCRFDDRSKDWNDMLIYITEHQVADARKGKDKHILKAYRKNDPSILWFASKTVKEIISIPQTILMWVY